MNPAPNPAAPRRTPWLFFAAAATFAGYILERVTELWAVGLGTACYGAALVFVLIGLITKMWRRGILTMVSMVLVAGLATLMLIFSIGKLVFWNEFQDYAACRAASLSQPEQEKCAAQYQEAIRRRSGG